MIKKIVAEQVYTGEELLENQLITVSGGKIVTIQPAEVCDGAMEVACLAAGFFDIHINGGARYHFTQKADQETIEDISRSSFATGTAYTLPTLITSSTENILKGIEAMRSYQSANPASGVMGMHLEGPFINPVKRGAHLSDYVRKPTNAELEEIVRHGKGVIRLMTVAPEQFSDDQLELIRLAGIVISAGHSNATYQQAKEAFGKGIQLVTHLYNAMSAFGHREPGLVGATFDTSSVYAPIILDGVHCDFAAARIAYKAKGEKLFLISDALFLGGGVKRFEWGDFDATLTDGKYVNSEGNLAGGAVSLGDTVRNAVQQVGIPLKEAIEMATIRPARALGIDNAIGRVQIGFPSVFTVFDSQLKDFSVVTFD